MALEADAAHVLSIRNEIEFYVRCRLAYFYLLRIFTIKSNDDEASKLAYYKVQYVSLAIK